MVRYPTSTGSPWPIRNDRLHAHLPILIVSGLTRTEDRGRALQVGANDFICKPVDPEEITLRVHWLIELKRAQNGIDQVQQLERTVTTRTETLRAALDGASRAQRSGQLCGHTESWGADILSGSVSPVIQMGERIARAHDEKWNGRGCPSGLAGEAFPLEAGICSVVDVFDALTMDRPFGRLSRSRRPGDDAR